MVVLPFGAQKRLAQAAGCSPAMISMVLKAKKRPSYDLAVVLGRELGTGVDVLMSRDPDRIAEAVAAAMVHEKLSF